MSYVQSLRFKLMLLCIVPLLSCAFLFIGHSVIIAFQTSDIAVEASYAAARQAGANASVLQAIQNTPVNMSWITRQWLIVFGILFVCFYIPITINIAKFIKPIRQLAKCSDSLAKGDIEVEVINNRTDEIGILQKSFQELVGTSQKQAELIRKIADNDISGEYKPCSDADVVGHSIVKMLDNNNDMMTNLSTAIQQISLVSKQISDGSQSLSSGATEQAAAIDLLNNTVKEVAKIPEESMKLAKKAVELTKEARTNAETGSNQMKDMVQAVNDIQDACVSIQKVIKVIDDIAFQTNILALNAAVEAARAGQHGKGFAVVAEEVRNLATKSATAAKDTDSLIANSMEKANLGVQIVNATSSSIEGIVTVVNKSAEILEEISQLSGNQNLSIQGISESLNQMADVVQSNSAMAEEYAASSEEMTGQATMILEMVSQFKLRNGLSSDKTLNSSHKRTHKQLTMPAKTSVSFDSNSANYGKY